MKLVRFFIAPDPTALGYSITTFSDNRQVFQPHSVITVWHPTELFGADSMKSPCRC